MVIPLLIWILAFQTGFVEPWPMIFGLELRHYSNFSHPIQWPSSTVKLVVPDPPLLSHALLSHALLSHALLSHGFPGTLPQKPLEGAIDFHVHSAPDVTPRSLNDFELAEKSVAAGMRAIVLKNHVTPTADRAVLAHQIVPTLNVLGGIVLNRTVGGLNPDAVEAMVKVGQGRGKVVWLPTIDADYHLKTFQHSGNGLIVAQGGHVLPATEAILQQIVQFDLVLGTGHISPEEVMIVVKRARSLGIRHILITHAMADVPGLSISQMQQVADLGAMLELTYVNDLMGNKAQSQAHRNWHRVSIEQMANAIQTIGAEHFVLSTDLGRQEDPLPPEGYKTFVTELARAGISAQDLDLMSRKNPAMLLDLWRTANVDYLEENWYF